MLIDYIDREKTTIAILKAWRDQEWKKETAHERIQELDALMTSTSSPIGSSPVQGGGSKREELLCSVIDKKNVEQQGHKRAEEYFADIAPAWERLTDEERFLLQTRFVDHGERRAIEQIVERLYISKSEAYNRTNAALKRLSTLLFW